MSRAQLQEIFHPVIEDILNAVEDQINKVKIRRMHQQHPKGAEIQV